MCFGCGKEGHKVKDCPEARERNQAKRKGGCHGCGQEGHYVRDCPRKQGRNQTQTHGQPPKQNQQDRQQERPQNQRHYQQNQTYQSRGNQQNPPQGQHYNHGRNNQGGNQAGQQQNGRVFAITHQDVEAANHVVEGTLLISNLEASTLLDSGSTHSFISHTFAAKIGNSPSTLTNALVVSTPTGEQICTRTIFYNCMIEIGQTRMPADLVLLRMDDFDAILGMDWLAMYRAVLDCFNKVI